MKPTRYLFLYTILPDYFYQCILNLVNTTNSTVLVFVYEVSSDIKIINKSNFKVVKLNNKRIFIDEIKIFGPEIIYICGWSNNLYNYIGFKYRIKAKVILGVDNLFKSSIKQKVGLLILKIFLKQITEYLWVPGMRQYYYAKLLGFQDHKILHSLYVSNTNKFTYTGSNYREKRIYFVGRLVDYKNPLLLIKTFKSLLFEFPALSNWKLIIYGRGPLLNSVQDEVNDNVILYEYISSEKLALDLNDASFLCMPSVNENWGVVLHEAASKGLPLLVSNSVGASSDLVIGGYNGYIFDLKIRGDFREKLFKFLNMDEHIFESMSLNSSNLSLHINYNSWISQLQSVLN